jgi:methylthioribose-1-phosphate isomerase
VEERDPSEVTKIAGKNLGPEGIEAFNPAFDITPAEYVDAIITERGVLRPPYDYALAEAFDRPAV